MQSDDFATGLFRILHQLFAHLGDLDGKVVMELVRQDREIAWTNAQIYGGLPEGSWERWVLVHKLDLIAAAAGRAMLVPIE